MAIGSVVLLAAFYHLAALDTFVPHTGSVSFNKHATKKDQFEKFNVKFTEKKYKNYNKEKLAMGTRVNANTEIGM